MTAMLSSALVLSACGRSPEEAILELQRCGARFTERDFSEAISEGDVEKVNLFLDGGMEVNRPLAGSSGRNPLTLAAVNNQVDIAKLLLKRGAEIHELKPGASSPLAAIAGSGKIKMAKLLLAAGADPNRKTGSRLGTPLHGAAERGTTDMIRILMRAGADPGVCDTWGATPLARAIRLGNKESFGEILRRSKRTSLEVVCANGKSALAQAIASEQPEMALALLEAGVDPGAANAKGELPLTHALARHLDEVAVAIVRQLRKKDPQAVQRSFAESVLYGRRAVARSMIKLGATVEDLEPSVLLFWAALSGQPLLADRARSEGVIVSAKDAREHTILERAAEMGHLNMVSWALENSSFSRNSRLGRTPVYLAASNGHLEVVRYLLQAGADPNMRTFRRDTALLAAARRSDLPMARLLLRHGANPTMHNGLTPLDLAAAGGNTGLVRLFIDAGLDVSNRSTGITPMLIAIENGNIDAALMLFEAGADPTIPREDGMTAALLVAQTGEERLLSLIRPPEEVENSRRRLNTNGEQMAYEQHSRARKEKGSYLLFQAIYDGQADAVGRLLAAGVSANAQRRGGDSALWVAVSLRKLDSVKALLNGGARATERKTQWGPDYIQEKSKKTLLMQAADRPEPDRWAFSKEEYEIRSREFYKQRPSQEPDPAQVKLVELLLNEGAEVNARDGNRKAALMFAAAYGNPDTVDCLLEHGADPNARARYGDTALQAAARRGDLRIVKTLLAADADPVKEDSQDRSPLFLAQREGHREVVDVLCAQPAVRCPEFEPAPDAKAPSGLSLAKVRGKLPEETREPDPLRREELGRYLVRSINEDDVEGVEKALAAGASPYANDRRGFPALLVAAGRRQHKIMKLLLEAGADVNLDVSRGATALVHAILANDPEGVKLLLKVGAEVNTQHEHGQSPLHFAIGTKNEIVRLLVKARADVNCRDDDGLTPVSLAAHDGRILRILLRERPWFSPAADANVPGVGCEGCTALLAAIWDLDAVELLLEAGAEVDVRDAQGRTPLTLAAGRGLGAVVLALLEAGAEIEETSSDGRNAVAHAAAHGSGEIIGLLARRGADVNVQDHQGMTPLMIAIRENSGRSSLSAVSALIAADVNPEQSDASGRTPLMWATRSCQSPVIHALLEWGIRVDAQDHEGRTALHHAMIAPEEKGSCSAFWSIIEALVEAGASVTTKDDSGVSPVDLAKNNRNLEKYLRDVARQQAAVSWRRELK